MHSTHDDILQFRQGRLPPSWGPRLEELAGKLEARAYTTLLNTDPHADSVGDVERARRLRADAAAGWLLANDGRVSVRPSPFGGVGSLHFEGNNGPVFWSLTAYSIPIPGVWRVYVLPTSRVAVGAEGWGSDPSDPGRPTADHVSQYRAAVLAAQGLDEQALGELRAGKIPGVVVARIRQESAILNTLASALASLGLMPKPRDIEREPVAALEGSPRFVEFVNHVNGSRNVTYKMEVSQHSFSSTSNTLVHQLFHLLAQGFPLRCYVTRSTGTLVAVEPAQGPG